MTTTTNNLNTFRLLYLIKGILTLCFSLFFVIYAAMGLFFARIPEFTGEPNPFPFNPGVIFLIVGVIGFLTSITMGVLTLLVSKYLKEQRNYTFIFVMAVLNCITGVLGILLGVFTIIELNKPEVKELFGKE